MTDLERLLRDTLDRDASDYPVGPDALPGLRRRLRSGTTPASSKRRRHVLLGVVVGVAAALLGVIAIPFSRSGSRPQTPATLGVASQLPAQAPRAQTPPPPSIQGVSSVSLGFTANRLVLAGDNVWAFGLNALGQSRVAHLENLRVVATASLPAPVCSASVRDASTPLAVVFGTNRTCTQRKTLRLLDPQQLTLDALSAPATGGDALVRPEGIYAVSAGVVKLLNPTTLLPTGPMLRLGGPAVLINLANDPGQTPIFATVFGPARHETTLVTLDRSTLHSDGSSSLEATAGALPYATNAGAVWVSLVGQDGSEAQLRDADGHVQTQAFAGFPLMTSYAESGARLWSLAPDHELSCASLATGKTMGQSTVDAPAGSLAANNGTIYAVNGVLLEMFTPTAGCAVN